MLVLGLVAGKSHSSIVRVDGLESIRRLPPRPLTISAEEIRAVEAYRADLAAWQRAQHPPGKLAVARAEQPIAVDGDFSDWPALNWVMISRMTEQHGWGRPQQVAETEAALAVDAQNLYIALKTRDVGLLNNRGDDAQTLFRTGGGVDLRLATRAVEAADGHRQPAPGDVRVVVALAAGKPLAAVYRPQVPGVQDPVVYNSPVSTVTIDRIDVVSDKVEIGHQRQNLASELNPRQKYATELIEIALPLDILGWDPETLPETTGDVGVLIGRNGVTVHRAYWHNKAASIVSDMPSEARLMPEQWGPVKVDRKKKTTRE